MTKYEWETELKKNIHRLPRPEQDKALAYYNELFADKAEAGYTETQIIAEFGNPSDVADKILAEYQFDVRPSEVETPPVKDKPAEPQEAQETAETPETQETVEPVNKAEKPTPQPAKPIPPDRGLVATVGSVIGGIFRIVFLTVGWVLAVAVWIVFGAVMLAGGCLVGGGVLSVIMGFATYTANIPGMFAAVGIGLMAAGIGLILCLNGGLFFRGAKKIGGTLTGKKKKVHYKINRPTEENAV